VKYLRLFIVLLLAVLLPLRGAVAATMLCASAPQAMTAGVSAHHDSDEAHGGAEMHEHAEHAHDHAGPDAAEAASSADAEPGTHSAACAFCAGGDCCVAPLAFAPPAITHPRLGSESRFVHLIATVAAGYPDGQDRPPRTT